MRIGWLGLTLLLLPVGGCGTTRWSDTPRTATEQLLLSDAMDRAVSKLDFNLIAGQNVYLDTSPVRNTIDSSYLISTVRQHLMASDCTIRDKAEEADFIIELRAGAIGTDRHELLFGIPATTLPTSTPGAGAQIIPELPLAKRTDQRAVAKVALFVYNRHTGRPVWQSGTIPVESKARDLWVLGAGPFQRGSIHQGTKFAGHKVPGLTDLSKSNGKHDSLPVTHEAIFDDPHESLARRPAPPQRLPPVEDGASSPPADKPPPYTPGPAIPSPPPATPAAPAGPSGMSSGLTMPNTQAPMQPAPVSGLSSGFSPGLKTRLPDIKLPWTSTQEEAEAKK